MPEGGMVRAGRIFVEQEPQFTDIQGSEWFYPILKRAYSLGIIQGYPDGTYKPGDSVKLSEALALLLRTNDITPTNIDNSGVKNFPVDLMVDSWYAPYLAYALDRFVVSPDVQNNIFPGKNITRGELAEILYRFIKSKDGMQFGKASWYGDGLSKIYPSTNQEYVDQNLTAAHKTYQFGTVVRATNLANGKSVDVVINDRGPFMPGRVLDLSHTAFSLLENPFHGVINVSVEVIKVP